MAVVTCPKCGAANDPAATSWNYCEKCGDRLPTAAATARSVDVIGPSAAVTVVADYATPPPAATVTGKPRRSKVLDAVAAALGVLLFYVVKSALRLDLGLLGEFVGLFLGILVMVGLFRGAAALFRDTDG